MYYAHRRGSESEQQASAYLINQGLTPITQNFSCKAGEIDLVMHATSPIQPDILAIIEVRYRRSQRYGGAAVSVTYGKQQRIRRATEYFCRTHRRYADWPVRFDVVAISGLPDNFEITWLPSAFEC